MGCPAVAVGPWLGRRRWFAPLDHLAIVLGDHPGHVGHCPVRDCHRVPVDDRSKRMANGEAGVDDGQEGGGHVGLDRLVEGWVEPRDRPLPASASRLACSFFHSWWGVRELVFVACLVERLLVRGDGCLEDGLAGGDVGQAAVDSQGDVEYLSFLGSKRTF